MSEEAAGSEVTAEATADAGTQVAESAAAEAQETTLLGGDNPAPEASAENQEAPEVEGAPESYADFEMPEGMQLDEAVLGDFSALAKELNLPQDQAQKIVDIASQKLLPAWQEQLSNQWKEQLTGWANESRNDEEIGGSKLPQALHSATKALDAFGTPALREVLETTGIGNHPEMIRFASKIGNSISQDGFVNGESRVAEQPAHIRRYGYMNES